MSELQQRSPVSPGEIVGGKYLVDRVLGSGGMGVVVAATQIELARSVALKFLLPASVGGDVATERFAREARAAVQLKSEHVARVYDVGCDGNRSYMVLELLEGLDLAKLLRTAGPLPVADAVEYVLQACDALVEAHSIGLVHRDLKPQNLFVTRRINGAPLVKVLDFGIAKAIGPRSAGDLSLTDSAAVIGSPLYMSPEQMRSARAADVRSDISGLGVVLYELLGGRLPFDGETVTEVCIRVVNDEPPSLDSVRPGLDPTLAGAVMRCLAKDPDQRWQSAAQLAAVLEPFAASSTTTVARAWRSLEDTQDPSDQTARIRAVAGLPRDVGSAPKKGASKPLASTEVTWGEATADPPSKRRAAPSRRRTALIVAATLLVGVCAGLGGRGFGGIVSRPTAEPLPPAALARPGPVLDSVPNAAAPVLSALPTPSATVAEGHGRRGLGRAVPARRAPPAEPSLQEPEPREAKAEPSKSEVHTGESPHAVVPANGAPILR